MHQILSEEEMVDASCNVDGFSGIYFLIENGVVVYVGQSTNIFNRLQSHSQKKRFDAVTILLCSPYKLDSMESIYIHSLRPKLNDKYSNGSMRAPLSFANALKMENTIPRDNEIQPSINGESYRKSLIGMKNIVFINLRKLIMMRVHILIYIFIVTSLILAISGLFMEFYSSSKITDQYVYGKNLDFFIYYFGFPSLLIEFPLGLYLTILKNRGEIVFSNLRVAK